MNKIRKYRQPRTRPKNLVRLGTYVDPAIHDLVKTVAKQERVTIEAWLADAAMRKLAA